MSIRLFICSKQSKKSESLLAACEAACNHCGNFVGERHIFPIHFDFPSRLQVTNDRWRIASIHHACRYFVSLNYVRFPLWDSSLCIIPDYGLLRWHPFHHQFLHRDLSQLRCRKYPCRSFQKLRKSQRPYLPQ